MLIEIPASQPIAALEQYLMRRLHLESLPC
ncbi:hypothetical protein SAMN04489799_5778 [Pseudomonas azotoformans]|nr:hypothetical protein SAMN04489799_5778 [Pseudomonas azotoformans]